MNNRADTLDSRNSLTQTKPQNIIKSSNVNNTKNNQYTCSYVSTHNNGTHSKLKQSNLPERYCHLCNNNNHFLYACTSFLNMSIRDRINFVDKKKVCRNVCEQVM